MLLTIAQVNAAMQLPAHDVQACLRAAGYSQDQVSSATYAGMSTSGCFVYRITYAGIENIAETANVYVRYQLVNGKLLLKADY